MTDVQARPDELSSFDTTETAAASQLETDRDTLDNTFIAFRNAPGGGCAAEGDAIIGEAMTSLIGELREIPAWVKLVHDALLAADRASENGLVSVNGVAFDSALRTLAAERNIDITRLAASTQITVTPPQVGTVPQDSGYVNDPVCTATGHLLVDSHDFAMPPRLDVLSFRRTYASQSMQPAAFGPGWWTWTECHVVVDGDGSFHYVGPDALQLTIPASTDGRRWVRADLDLTVERLDENSQVLHWGRRSRTPNQHWTFRDGLLAEVAGPFIGSTTFHHRSRRLIGLEHESGRTLELRWKGDRVVEITSSDGRRARFAYDPAGALVAVDNALSPESYKVDDSGRILAITDADGIRTVAMAYDVEGRVIEQTSATGFTTRFDFDEVRRTTLSDPDFNPLSVYTHDERGRVEMYATGGGFRFTRRFDSLGRVVSQRDPDGRSFTLVDSSAGGLHREEVRWSSGDVERYDYDDLDRLVRQSSNTASTRFSYEGDSMFPSRVDVVGEHGLAVDLDWQFGSPTRIADSDGVVDHLTVRPDGTIATATNGVGDTTGFDVDASGAVVAVHRPGGRVVRYERDEAGRLTAVINAAGQRGEIRYSPAGRILSCVNPDGATSSVEYDRAGLPERLVAADGTATDLLVDDKQRILGARFANGDVVGLQLDEFGRQIAVDVNDDRWVMLRDPAGRIVKQADPTGRELAQLYGDLGGWMAITDAAGQTWRMERDLVDRVRTLTTPDGRQYTAAFEPEGLLASQTTPDGRQEHYTYTNAGRLSEVSDGTSTLRYRYDDAGRVVGLDNGTGWWTFDLDVAGNITRRVSPAGREQRYEHNVLGQLVALHAAGETWRFDYDTAGRLTRSLDPTACESRFTYDVTGRMVESADSLGSAVRYGYDVRGRVAEMVDAHGGVVRYEHTALNQLASITDQLGRQTIVEYDAAGRHVATSYRDPRTAAGPSRLDLAELAGAGDDVASAAGNGLPNVMSSAGMVTTWTLPDGQHIELVRDADLLPERLSSPGFVRTWTHDPCGRVIAVVDHRDGTTSTTSLRRDAAGRVIEQDVDGDVTTYAYDGAGQLLWMSDSRGQSSWDYDALGRLVGERTPDCERRFRYDTAHQLVELTDAAGTTTFEYDARGRRVKASGAVEITYVWGASRLEAVVADGDVCRFDTDATGALRRAGDTTVAWDLATGPPRPTSLNGTPVITVDSGTFATVAGDSTVRWRQFELADAWGDDFEHDGGWHPYFGVAARGVVWLGARPYDVATRQFLVPDPLAPVPGRAGSTSPYTYAANDPINLFDPSGRSPISIEAFNDIRDRRTGAQWQNIATVAIAATAIVVTIATLGTAGPVAMVLGGAAIGAISGAASGAAREGLEAGMNLGDGDFNGETIIRDAVVGGLGGAAGGGLGAGANALTTSTRLASTSGVRLLSTRGGSMLSEGASGAVDGIIGETYDTTMPASWGADGRWDNGAIVLNTVMSTGAGGLLHNVGAPGHGGADVPTAGSADPNTVNSPDSPAPDLPDPTPAGADADTPNPADTSHAADGPGTHSADTPSTPEAADTPDTPDTADTPDAAETPEAADSPDAADSPEPADTPDTPDTAGTPDTPEAADTPETPDTTDTPDTSDAADTPDTADTPDAAETPDAADTPEAADTPDLPDTADTPDTPDAADTPETADTPEASDTPDTPDTADTPDTPEAADTPDTPDTADTPEAADTPDTPDTPEAANTPDTADTPDTPDAADTPDSPDTADTPEAADTPDTPDIADTPEAADTPDSPDTADTPEAADTSDTPDSPELSDGEAAAAGVAATAGARVAADAVANVSPDSLVRTARSFRTNRFEFVGDADGTTRSVRFEINESATGLDRGAAEVRAQGDAADRGLSTDHGGHIVAHRFASDQGDINMFPQDAQFNNSAYKKLENELAAWVESGFQVDGFTTLDGPPGSARPYTITVDYVVTNPQTGEIVHWRAVEFQNQDNQTFSRMSTRQVRAQHGVTHELRVRGADGPGSDAADSAATERT